MYARRDYQVIALSKYIIQHKNSKQFLLLLKKQDVKC